VREGLVQSTILRHVREDYTQILKKDIDVIRPYFRPIRGFAHRTNKSLHICSYITVYGAVVSAGALLEVNGELPLRCCRMEKNITFVVVSFYAQDSGIGEQSRRKPA
jgi:hypothetical protein